MGHAVSWFPSQFRSRLEFPCRLGKKGIEPHLLSKKTLWRGMKLVHLSDLTPYVLTLVTRAFEKVALLKDRSTFRLRTAKRKTELVGF